MDVRDPLSSCSASATTSGQVVDTLHPDDAARDSRKRTLGDPGDEHKVSRERSASRHKEVKESGSVRSALL
jgi:hypothetical protein